jgi:hypothetical protein
VAGGRLLRRGDAKTACARVLAPRGALPLSFSVISLVLSGTGPPDLPHTVRADDWSFCWPFFRTFPFLSLYLGTVRVPWHSTRNSLPTSPWPQLAILLYPPDKTRSNYIHVHFL